MASCLGGERCGNKPEPGQYRCADHGADTPAEIRRAMVGCLADAEGEIHEGMERAVGNALLACQVRATLLLVEALRDLK